MGSISYNLPHALADEKWRKWVLEKFYPPLVKNMEDTGAGDETRKLAVSKFGQIDRH